MKKLLIGLTLLASISLLAEQPSISISKIKHASEQAMDQFVQTDQGKNLIDYTINDDDLSLKYFSYTDSTGNLAQMHTSYLITVEEGKEMKVYLCNSEMALKILGKNIFTLVSSNTKCDYQYLQDEDVYHPNL